MAKIPGVERQRLMPSTTGGARLQVVQQSTAEMDAIGNAANLVQGIGQKMFEADSKAQLSTANVNTQMELSVLQTQLEKGDSETAMADYATGSQAIYAKNAEGMSPLVLAEYDSNYATLSTKTNLSLVGTIAAKRASDRVAGGMVLLDSMIKMYAPPSKDPNKSSAQARQDREAALAHGDLIVSQLVASNDKTPEQGAKMLLDFHADFNDARFVGWVNSLSQGEVNSAFVKMSTGDFGDDETNQEWAKLPEKRKGALISQSITNASRLLSAQDAQDRRDLLIRQGEAKRLQIEFATSTDPARRQAILLELADNPGMTPTLYDKMVQDAAGATNRFDDPVAIRQTDIRIMRHGPDMTQDEIMLLPFSDPVLARMMSDLEEVQDDRMRDAMDLVLSSPLFAPSSSSEKRTQGDAMDQRQLKIKNQLISDRIDARDSGEAFDPVDRARELLKLLTADDPAMDPEKRQQAATNQLRDEFGINNAKDLRVYMGAGHPSGDKIKVNDLYKRAFPNGR
jgi:hypothetical protein